MVNMLFNIIHYPGTSRRPSISPWIASTRVFGADDRHRRRCGARRRDGRRPLRLHAAVSVDAGARRPGPGPGRVARQRQLPRLRRRRARLQLAAAAAARGRTPRPGRGGAVDAGDGRTAGYAAWLALRFAAGVASAFVLVGVSAWAMAALGERGRAGWAGGVFCRRRRRHRPGRRGRAGRRRRRQRAGTLWLWLGAIERGGGGDAPGGRCAPTPPAPRRRAALPRGRSAPANGG